MLNDISFFFLIKVIANCRQVHLSMHEHMMRANRRISSSQNKIDKICQLVHFRAENKYIKPLTCVSISRRNEDEQTMMIVEQG